jgi:hypothetical protein
MDYYVVVVDDHPENLGDELCRFEIDWRDLPEHLRE